MKRALVFAFLLLIAGLAIPHNAFADKPPDTFKTFVWGDTYAGQSGTGVIGLATTPVAVDQRALAPFTDLATGERHSCALDGHGRAYCWGYGYSGELGNGTNATSNRPVPVDTSGVLAHRELVGVAAGTWFTCAVDTEGLPYCWGHGSNGELGNSGTTNSLIPVAVDTSGVLSGRSLSKIRAGGSSACGLDRHGRAYCWGWNNFGQLGDGTTTTSSVPVAVDTSGVLDGVVLVDLTINGGHACAIDDQGKAYCWGNNGLGELGDGGTTPSSSPVAVDLSGAPGSRLIDIAAGGSHTCAVTDEGKGLCWGHGYYGQLGRNSTTTSPLPGVVDNADMPPTARFASVSAGSSHTCAVDHQGAGYCWGMGADGRLGTGAITDALRPQPVAGTPVVEAPFTAIRAGLQHTCAIDDEGAAYCWGGGHEGELGNGRTSVIPSPVAGPAADVVTAGDNHSCGLAADGTATCWGEGSSGQLGTGVMQYAPEPVPVNTTGVLAGKRLVVPVKAAH